MQRINWFPDPLITGKLSAEINNGAAKAVVVADNKNWLRVTSTATGDNFGQFSLSDGLIPPAGTYHVHARVYAQKAAANFIVYSNVNSSWKQLLNKPVADGQTLTVDSEITIPEGCQPLLVRMQLGREVGLIGMMSQILIESADTYDKAVGGASGLLLGGHDATRLRRSVGRVMSDDGHEPDKQSKRPRHAGTGRVHADFDHRKADWRRILVHGLVGRVGRLRHGGQLSGHLQQEPTHRMVPHVPEHESDEPEIQGRVRQSDRQGVEHGHVRAGRIPGEQGIARQHLLFRRGYDATRLTLALGVVA